MGVGGEGVGVGVGVCVFMNMCVCVLCVCMLHLCALSLFSQINRSMNVSDIVQEKVSLDFHNDLVIHS